MYVFFVYNNFFFLIAFSVNSQLEVIFWISLVCYPLFLQIHCSQSSFHFILHNFVTWYRLVK
jgi:hypothetical protein